MVAKKLVEEQNIKYPSGRVPPMYVMFFTDHPALHCTYSNNLLMYNSQVSLW